MLRSIRYGEADRIIHVYTPHHGRLNAIAKGYILQKAAAAARAKGIDGLLLNLGGDMAAWAWGFSRVIDYLLTRPDIDPQRIGFFGWSRGGYTGLVLAGAVPSFRYPLVIPCPDNLLMCRQIRDGNIPKQGPGYDPRIKAYVIADPVNLFPDKASLQKVVAPIQLWSSERGGMGVRPDDVALLEKSLPHTPEFHRPANSGHFAFFFPCSKELTKTDPLECDDPTGFDRAAFHRKFNAQVLEFFRKNLFRQEP